MFKRAKMVNITRVAFLDYFTPGTIYERWNIVQGIKVGSLPRPRFVVESIDRERQIVHFRREGGAAFPLHISRFKYFRYLKRVGVSHQTSMNSPAVMYAVAKDQQHEPKPVAAPDIKYAKCQCEHACHFDSSQRSPNGNPSHKYGIAFHDSYMLYVSTTYGTFYVCRDCAEDCHGVPVNGE